MENTNRKKRVLVAMSGGVDSSVAAAVLKEQGFDVIGVTMQVWDYTQTLSCDVDEGNGTCCSSLDVDDARAVADKLDIPFYVINCEAQFRTTVIDNFVKDYLAARTPIPCVNCNTFLKFDHLVQKMKELDCDYLATGHYAQVLPGPGGQPQIITSSDDWKDQTYFLFTLNKELLPKLMFPIGNWVKPELRAYAEKTGLAVARKKDSTGICFIGKEGYSAFIENEVPKSELRPGLIRKYPTGEILAQHDGIHKFTIGQRRGLGVATGEPAYVVKIEVSEEEGAVPTGTVWLGDEKYLFSTELLVERLNWLDEVSDGEVVKVKIRYAHKGSDAIVVKRDDGTVILRFFEPQRSVTPGQAAVFYRGKQLLGGGWIVKKLESADEINASPVVKTMDVRLTASTESEETGEVYARISTTPSEVSLNV